MPRYKTDSARAAGKLIKEIDRERMEQIELGILDEEKMESKLSLAHSLLQAKDSTEMSSIMRGKTVQQYFSSLWLEAYPKIMEAANALQAAIHKENSSA